MKRAILVALFGAFLPVWILMSVFSVKDFKESAAMIIALVLAEATGYADGRSGK